MDRAAELAGLVAADGLVHPATQEWAAGMAAQMRSMLEQADAIGAPSVRAAARRQAAADALLVIEQAERILDQADEPLVRAADGRRVSDLGVDAADLDPTRLQARIAEAEAGVAVVAGLEPVDAKELARAQATLAGLQRAVVHRAGVLARMAATDLDEGPDLVWARWMMVRMRAGLAAADAEPEPTRSAARATVTDIALGVIERAPRLLRWADGGPVTSVPLDPPAEVPALTVPAPPTERRAVDILLQTVDTIRRGHISPVPQAIDRGAQRVAVGQIATLLDQVGGLQEVDRPTRNWARSTAARLRTGLEAVPEQVTAEHAPELDRLFGDSERAVVTVKKSLGLPADKSLAVVVEPAPGLQPAPVPPSGDDDPPPSGPAGLTSAEPPASPPPPEAGPRALVSLPAFPGLTGLTGVMGASLAQPVERAPTGAP